MIVKDRDSWEYAFGCLIDKPYLAVDLETTGLYPFNGDKIVGVAAATDQQAFYFPFGHTEGNIPGRHVWHLCKLLTKVNTLYVMHNGKFDLKFLAKAGIPLPNKVCDTMLGAKLHNENEPAGLKQWADKYIGPDSSAEQTEIIDALAELGYKGKKAMGHLAELPPDLVGKYAMQDVRLTLQVFNILRHRLGRYGLLKLWKEYNQYLLALTRMELRGITVDTYQCAVLSKEFDDKAATLLEFLKHRVGRDDFNPRSPKQICEFLGISSSKKSVMDDLAEKQGPRADFARQLLDYRKLAKARGTYFEPYKKWVSPDDGAIHCNLYLGGTKTGRLSCNDPNLQQVPRDADTVKTVFVARPGKVFIEADYEQAELRLAADLANEQRMIDVFRDGRDPHTETAEALNITRHAAKTTNFGTIYGLGARGLAAQLKVPESTARDILKRFHTEFPGFKRAARAAEKQATEDGFVRMWTGRLRRFDEEYECRKAFNSCVQGGVAEIVRRAITRIDRERGNTLYDQGLQMLLTVHDSILFEVPETLAESYIPLIIDAMTADNVHFKVPQAVDLKVGKSWGSMNKPVLTSPESLTGKVA